MLYIILELINGTIRKGRATQILKYPVTNNDGPCFIHWVGSNEKDTDHQMIEHNQIKTISIFVEK